MSIHHNVCLVCMDGSYSLGLGRIVFRYAGAGQMCCVHTLNHHMRRSAFDCKLLCLCMYIHMYIPMKLCFAFYVGPYSYNTSGRQ